MDSPYFAELAARISEEAAALGFIVLLDVTGGDADEIGRRTDHLPMVLLGERPVPAGLDHVAAMQQLLHLCEPPDAVFCFNDLMATSALRACVEAEVSVPGEWPSRASTTSPRPATPTPP